MNSTSVNTNHINRTYTHKHTRTLHLFIYNIDSCTDILYRTCKDELYFCEHNSYKPDTNKHTDITLFIY